MPTDPPRLSDGEVAVLARQAVDLLDPDAPIDIVPDEGADPYRWNAGADRAWVVWPRLDGRRSFGVHLSADLTPGQALERLLDTMANDVADTERHWGSAFPPCPGHRHGARVALDAGTDEVVLSCPDTGAEVARLRPESAGPSA